MSKKHRHLGFKEYYEAVMHAILNDIKDYEVKPKNGSKKEFYITKKSN